MGGETICEEDKGEAAAVQNAIRNLNVKYLKLS
jgi:hypothetical protein